MKLLLHCVVFIRVSFQIRVVSQEVRLNASQLDELYNLFKVSPKSFLEIIPSS